MKTLHSTLLTEYATEGKRIATIIKFTRRDGLVFGFAEHDRDLLYGNVLYRAVTGIIVSQIETSAGLNVHNLEVSGFVDEDALDIIEEEAGAWDGAEFEILDVIWNQLTVPGNVWLTGWIGEIKRKDFRFSAELRSLQSKLQTNWGQVISPSCPYRFGDSDCKFDLGSVTVDDVPVVSVSSNSLFEFATGEASGYYDRGTVTFTTGLNTGYSQDIKMHFTSLGAHFLQMQVPFYYPIVAGDEFTLTPGCNKLLKTGVGVYGGDCKVKWDNVVNFGGEPEVPLMNQLMQLK